MLEGNSPAIPGSGLYQKSIAAMGLFAVDDLRECGVHTRLNAAKERSPQIPLPANNNPSFISGWLFFKQLDRGHVQTFSQTQFSHQLMRPTHGTLGVIPPASPSQEMIEPRS
jgi:hypothetical protein